MVKNLVMGFAVATLVCSSSADAQWSAGVRAGTLGIGPEVAFALSPMLALKGGIGMSQYHYEGDFSDKQFTIDTPPQIWNAGVEFSPGGGGFHLIAGVMNRPQFDLTGRYVGSTQIGNNTYSGTVNLVGNMKNSSEIGPYAGIGFGRSTKSGFGVSLDLGVGYLGEGKITFTSATCTQSNGQACPNAQFQSDVQAETAKVNNDIASYVKWHPLLSLSFHYGFSR